jgi:hypothetical protein
MLDGRREDLHTNSQAVGSCSIGVLTTVPTAANVNAMVAQNIKAGTTLNNNLLGIEHNHSNSIC